MSLVIQEFNWNKISNLTKNEGVKKKEKKGKPRFLEEVWLSNLLLGKQWLALASKIREISMMHMEEVKIGKKKKKRKKKKRKRKREGNWIPLHMHHMRSILTFNYDVTKHYRIQRSNIITISPITNLCWILIFWNWI